MIAQREWMIFCALFITLLNLKSPNGLMAICLLCQASCWVGKGSPSTLGVVWFRPLECLDAEGDFKTAGEAGLTLQSSNTTTHKPIFCVKLGSALSISP